MITYEVYYKSKNSLLWKKLKKVKGDGFIENDANAARPTKDVRWFILEDETRIEIPSKEYIFKFSKERHYSIKERMEIETNTNIKTNPK